MIRLPSQTGIYGEEIRPGFADCLRIVDADRISAAAGSDGGSHDDAVIIAAIDQSAR